MEGMTKRVYKGVKGYWRRRGYERLGSKTRRRRTTDELEESGGGRQRRRSWRIRITRRLKLKVIWSPKKFLVGLRDAYMRMMMRMASSTVVNGGGIGGYGGEGAGRFGVKPIKEYDEKMIIEIYKTLAMARGGGGDQIGVGVPRICSTATRAPMVVIHE